MRRVKRFFKKHQQTFRLDLVSFYIFFGTFVGAKDCYFFNQNYAQTSFEQQKRAKSRVLRKVIHILHRVLHRQSRFCTSFGYLLPKLYKSNFADFERTLKPSFLHKSGAAVKNIKDKIKSKNQKSGDSCDSGSKPPGSGNHSPRLRIF